jgi:hypothetical protein
VSSNMSLDAWVFLSLWSLITMAVQLKSRGQIQIWGGYNDWYNQPEDKGGACGQHPLRACKDCYFQQSFMVPWVGGGLPLDYQPNALM